VRLWRDRDGIRVGGGHVQIDVPFTDLVELEDAHTFSLQGRSADLVNIAGKRSSVAYLNQQLLAIEGVEDGVFFLPDGPQEGVTRLVAFVVAPGLPREALLSALRTRIDPAFLPAALLRGCLAARRHRKLARSARAVARSLTARPGAERIMLHFPPSIPALHDFLPVIRSSLRCAVDEPSGDRARTRQPPARAVKWSSFSDPCDQATSWCRDGSLTGTPLPLLIGA
jgi:hypothetical protein